MSRRDREKVSEEITDQRNEDPVKEPLMGMVANCSKLNVRWLPNKEADVVCELEAGAKVEVFENESTDEWYKVCTEAGAEGFCMKYFIGVLVD